MSTRWVLPHLFKVQSARIHWSDEYTRLRYEGAVLQTGMDEAPLQFRWLLHPVLGFPRQPFILWRNRHPGGNLSTQELANIPGWQPLEVIGLPVDNSWYDTGYDLNDQGPIQNPLPPIQAALQRLQLGAPRIGWTRLNVNNFTLPDWEPSNLEAYLEDLLKTRLMRGIQAMLRDLPNGREHEKYVVIEKDESNPGRVNPRLLLHQSRTVAGINQPARSEWHPLGLLLVGAGTDPLAALALGFGTARSNDGETDDLFMVSVRHRMQVEDQEYEFELADVVTVNQQLPVPESPTGLSARIIGHNRPQVLDGPALETVGVSWDRSENPNYSFLPPNNTGLSVTYAVGRFGPHFPQSEILLTRRAELVRGWFPFVASKPDTARPVIFADHIVRSTFSDSQKTASPLGLHCAYAVAAQDIFGRWSHWTAFEFQGPDEPPQTPSILSVKSDPSGAFMVDFSWDWSDRSPEFIELIGTYEDTPDSRLFTTRLEFGGYEAPKTSGFEVIPLDSERNPAAGWGGAQDRDPLEPEVRFYRLIVSIPILFAGKHSRFFQVQARGQCHVHQLAIPDWNVSPFCQPVGTQIYDTTPPPLPTVPEEPQWASLSDIAGVNRVQLRWSGDVNVAGYILYEATETTLLAALGLPGPDTTKPFTERLAVLRAANLTALRSAFRRVRKELIPRTEPETVYEMALPRGSTVMHFYAVTAMSHNQVESCWPDNSKKFIAVAAPRLALPVAPSLEVSPLPESAQTLVNLRIKLGYGVPVDKIELYRVANDKLATNVDTMGPPIATLSVTGPEMSFTDDTLTPGWRRVWYRTVAWSACDDQRGVIEARSPASSAVSVLLPPNNPPEVIDLKVNEPGSSSSEVLVSWTSHAPVAVTPLGPHNFVLETRDGAGSTMARIEGRLDALTAVDSRNDLPHTIPTGSAIVRVGDADSYRMYARLTRPAVDQSFSVTVKIIDPLGRISSVSADVPPRS